MEKDFNPGKIPEDRDEEINGLSQAIDSTQARIKDFKSSGADTTELDTHLKDLKTRFDQAVKEREDFESAQKAA